MPPTALPGPSTKNAINIETILAEASEQLPVVEVGEGTTTPNPPITSEDPTNEPRLRIAAVQLLINLEEEPIVIDVDEEPEVAVNPTAI